ncbi:hypothetical protein ACK8QS_05415 [Ectopseudomonas mendocina]
MNTTKENTQFEIFKEIQSCPGTKFVNRLHVRSFSANIFQRNAVELMEETRKVQDPDLGLPLMAEDNREIGQQAHRELSRHLHNFLAAAKTLVDHTRVFIKEGYEGTSIAESYQQLINETFANDPASKFVHDLRNYMLHKGQPSTSMFLSFSNVEDSQAGELTTGIRFDTGPLLEWSSWTAPARKYIEASGEHIDIYSLAADYLRRTTEFHMALDRLLMDYHREDLEYLSKLQSAYSESSRTDTEAFVETNPAPPSVIVAPVLDFYFAEEINEKIGQMSIGLMTQVQEIHLQEITPDEFSSQRPVAATFKDTEIIGTPIYQGYDAQGIQYLSFIRVNGKAFGLLGEDIGRIDGIASVVLDEYWAQDKLGREFLNKAIIEWVQRRFADESYGSLVDDIVSKSKSAIKKLDVIMPIAHLEIESPFEFGEITVEPFSSEKIDVIRELASKMQSANDNAQKLIEKIESDFQGFALFSINIEAEPTLAAEKGLKIAQAAIDLLNFFSPAAPRADTLCPTALSGAEIVPRTKVLALSSDSFYMCESLAVKNNAFWKMSNANIDRLKDAGMQKAGRLIIPEGLTSFETVIRSAILIYSRSLAQVDIIDRLNHAILSLESVFLKHDMEPTITKISSRMSKLLAQDVVGQNEISNLCRQAYQVREKHISLFRSPREQEIIKRFVYFSRCALNIALHNADRFNSKIDFISALDAQ